MSLEVANLIVRIGLVYAGLGLLFAVPFAWFGAGRIDPVARDGSWGFRVLIVPGAAALWPWLLLRWVRGSAPTALRTPHTTAARAPDDGAGKAT